MRQIQEVQMWRLCETRDLGIIWPYWHTLAFSDEKKVDVRYVCPRDVKKMLVQRARSGYSKKWAAKHEHEELKEGVYFEPVLAHFRKKAKGDWTEEHRNVARKLMSSLPVGGRHRIAQALPFIAQNGTKSDWESQRLEQKARTSKEEWEWQRGIVTHPLSGSQWNRDHFHFEKVGVREAQELG